MTDIIFAASAPIVVFRNTLKSQDLGQDLILKILSRCNYANRARCSV